MSGKRYRCFRGECYNPDCISLSGTSKRHKAAFKLFTEKFRKGAQEHGDLKPHKKWTKDQLNETIDLVFYLVFELLEKK